MSLGDGNAFTCWCCQRECYGERIASGAVLICGPCDRLEPCPPVLAPVALSEPAAPPAPPAVEAAKLADSSEGATGGCALPSGWSEDRRGRKWMTACFKHESEACVWRTPSADFWRWAPDDEAQRGTAPTMLTAMCCALGLQYADTSDDCARAALEAFHARQQALKAQPGTPATAHPRPAGEVRGTGGKLSGAPEATGHPVTPNRLLELAAEALKAAGKAREAALELEGLAARIRAACARAAAGGER